MTKEGTILLMESKLRAYRAGFLRASAKGDSAAEEKWKEGYISIQERIAELKED